MFSAFLPTWNNRTTMVTSFNIFVFSPLSEMWFSWHFWFQDILLEISCFQEILPCTEEKEGTFFQKISKHFKKSFRKFRSISTNLSGNFEAFQEILTILKKSHLCSFFFLIYVSKMAIVKYIYDEKGYVLRWLYCLTIIGCNFVLNDLLHQTLISYSGPWFTFSFMHIWWHHDDVIKF